MLVRKYKCNLCYTQMYHSRILFEDSKYLERSFHTCKEDRPLVIQVCALLLCDL